MQKERLEKATDWIPLNEPEEWAMCKNKKDKGVTSLKGQWLRLHASNAGGIGSIPGQRTKILHVPWCSKKKKKKNKGDKANTKVLPT